MRKGRSSTRDDYDKVKDALQKLRSENRKLRKQNSQLRKQLNRVDDVDLDREVDEEEAALGPLIAVEEAEKPNCPKCKSEDFKVIRAGLYLIKACVSCGYRKRTEARTEA